VSRVQALVEFYCFTPLGACPVGSTPQQQHPYSHGAQLRMFEAFWDSPVPRAGEEGARGWAAWFRCVVFLYVCICLWVIFVCMIEAVWESSVPQVGGGKVQGWAAWLGVCVCMCVCVRVCVSVQVRAQVFEACWEAQ
jgi:hypothetical protein